MPTPSPRKFACGDREHAGGWNGIVTTLTGSWPHPLAGAQGLQRPHSRCKQRLAAVSFPLGGDVKGRTPRPHHCHTSHTGRSTLLVVGGGATHTHTHLGKYQQEVLNYRRTSILAAPLSSPALKHLMLLF